MLVGPRWLQLVVVLLLFLGTLTALPKLVVWEGNPLAKGTGAPIDTSPLGQSGLVDFLRSSGYNVSLSLGDAMALLPKTNYTVLVVVVSSPSECGERVLGLYRALVDRALSEKSRVLVIVGDETDCYREVLGSIGVKLYPLLYGVLYTSDGLKAIPVIYDEGGLFIGYTVRAMGGIPFSWQPEGLSMDPPARVVAASLSLEVRRAGNSSKLDIYMVSDSDLFRNVVFEENGTGVKDLVAYLLDRYQAEPGDTLVVVPVEFTLGASPVDIVEKNPMALFHPGILFLALIEVYLYAENSFIEFLYSHTVFLLSVSTALSLLAYALVARHVEEAIAAFKPPPPHRAVTLYGVSEELALIISGRSLPGREARKALLNLYRILDSVLAEKYGRGVEGVLGDERVLKILAERTGLSIEEVRARLSSLRKYYERGIGAKKYPPLVLWRRVLEKELEKVEPILRAVGVSLEEARGLEIGFTR